MSTGVLTYVLLRAYGFNRLKKFPLISFRHLLAISIIILLSLKHIMFGSVQNLYQNTKNLQYLGSIEWSGASTAAFPGDGSLSRFTTRTSLHLRLIPFILALFFLNLSFFACFCFCCSDSLRFFVPFENFSLIWRRHHY